VGALVVGDRALDGIFEVRRFGELLGGVHL
jgi:hypothetical protein